MLVDEDENLGFDKIAGSDFERRRYGGGPQGAGQDARSYPGLPANSETRRKAGFVLVDEDEDSGDRRDVGWP